MHSGAGTALTRVLFTKMPQLGTVSSAAPSPGSPDTGGKGGFHSSWQLLALVILQRVHQGHGGVGTRFSRSSTGQGTAGCRNQGTKYGEGSEREGGRAQSL